MNREKVTNIMFNSMKYIAIANLYKLGEKDIAQNTTNCIKKMQEALSKEIDFEKLTKDDCRFLRFGKLDEDSNVYIIPAYIVGIIPDGLEVVSISGEKFNFSKDKTDLDTRFGYVAFGIIPKDCTNEGV